MSSSNAQSVKHPSASILQTAKDREFHKYHNPANINHAPKASVSCVPYSSHDVALTSFAQLGALRLNAKRCMISLFDTNNQYIIAEATRTLSLQSDDIHEPDDGLWLGVSNLPKSGGICQFVVDLPSPFAPDDPKGGRNDVYIIPDLAKDERFADKAFVTSKPFARFYAGVPICSPKGYYIGSYCILDDRPRETVGGHALQFMKDISRTVMEHLGLTRAREEQRRGERMVRGLGSFYGGKSKLSNLQPSHGSDEIVKHGNYNLSISGVGESQNVQSDWDSQSEQLKKEEFSDAARRSPRESSRFYWPAASSPSRKPGSGTKYSSFTKSRNVSPSMVSESAVEDSVPNPPARHSNQVTSHPSGPSSDILSTGVKAAFSRAANIVRESIEVEGAVFFDASINSYSGLVKGNVQELSENTWSETASSSAESLSEDGDAASVNARRISNSNPDSEKRQAAGILGYSILQSSSINNDAAPVELKAMPEEVLISLAKRFSNGKIFHFGEDGLISSGSSSEENQRWTSTGEDKRPASSRRKSKTYSAKAESESINKIFPGVRCLALMPLWDSNRERWFAMGFLWTTSPNRLLTLESELSYLAVFGNTIMAEVARLDATTADKAKSDLLGSISHELRSPLHGILGSVELLEDSMSNTHQHDLVHSIETCGRTLLETINHLLEYSRINHSYELYKDIKRAERKRRIGKLTLKNNARSSDAVDIAAVTEEVMAVVTAGHEQLTTSNVSDDGSHKRRSSFLDDTHSSVTPGSNVKPAPLGNVDLSLDIPGNFSWNFKIQSGAWRRLVMNLFSNSLKYMDKEHGFVKVTLRQEVLPSKQKYAPNRSKVILNVTDTGRGMSQEYLQQRLFTPFAQEDQLAPGTGLGLSIVRQIVSSLGGKITVTSLKGIGTDIRVSFVMSQDPHPSPVPDDLYDVALVAGITKDLDVVISGIEAPQNTGSNKEYPKTSESGMWLHGVNGLNPSLETMCRDWFGLRIRTDIDENLICDLCIIVENQDNFSDLRTGRLFDQLEGKITQKDGSKQLRLIVLCKTTSSAGILKIALGQSETNRGSIILISQPCGPRKLARALRRCLEKVSESATKPLSAVEPGASQTISDWCGQPEPYTQHLEDTESPLAKPLVGVTPSRNRVDVEGVQCDEIKSVVPSEENVNGSGPFLLVDDNHINLRVLSMYMEKLGHDYDTAVDGLQALQAFKAAASPYRTVFMDISMPVMDGLASTRAIRAYELDNSLSPCTVIVLTGLGSASARQEAFASGANMMLTKPVKLKELGEIVQNMHSVEAQRDR